jgi:hypothetical protein
MTQIEETILWERLDRPGFARVHPLDERPASR